MLFMKSSPFFTINKYATTFIRSKTTKQLKISKIVKSYIVTQKSFHQKKLPFANSFHLLVRIAGKISGDFERGAQLNGIFLQLRKLSSHEPLVFCLLFDY